jgi:16S rRNA (cytosine1402-N4)-methyltransferase
VIVHEPVLLEETLTLLVPPADDGLLVDATLGQGGHAEAFLKRYPELFLIGVDADSAVLETARERLSPFSNRIELVRAWFGDFFSRYAKTGGERLPDIVLFDLGISSYHYKFSGRGFSFDREEPLDMRLDPGLPESAADLVGGSSRQELAGIFREFGEERFAWEIAGRIVRERERSPISTSARLARVIAEAVPPSYRHGKIHPATRCFQALRIAVNGELDRIGAGLAAAFGILKPGGRIGVITFHSLEDRIVKRFFLDKAKGCTCPPEWPICQCGGKPELRVVTRKPVLPSEREIIANPPSRSAKLRVAEKGAA